MTEYSFDRIIFCHIEMNNITFLRKEDVVQQFPGSDMICIYLDGNQYIYNNNFGYNYVVACIVPVSNKVAGKPVYPKNTYFSIKPNKKQYWKVIMKTTKQQSELNGKQISFYPTQTLPVPPKEV